MSREEIENHKADAWHDQRADDEQREKENMIALYPATPGTKARETSANAAEAMTKNAGLLREQVLHLLQYQELTADECATMLRKSILSIRPRVSELAAVPEIFDTGKRRKNESGHAAIVWSASRQPNLL